MATRKIDSGEVFAKITVFEIFPHCMGNYRPVKPYCCYKQIVIAFLKIKKLALQKLLLGRLEDPVRRGGLYVLCLKNEPAREKIRIQALNDLHPGTESVCPSFPVSQPGIALRMCTVRVG